MSCPIPRVMIPIDHPLSVACRTWRLWSKPSPRDGQYTAEVFVGFSWVLVAFILVMICTPEGVMHCLIILGLLDVAMRIWRIRSTVLFVPISIWCLGLLLLLWFRQ